MNRAVVHFGVQCFQLRDVHRVGVFRAGRDARDLTGIFLFFIAYRNRALRRFPYFRCFFSR